MSSNIDIVLDGYADISISQSNRNLMRASGSSCLVRSSGMNILFDTLGPWEKDLLLSKLESLKIHTDDINYLVCSHSHPDHIGNLNLFTKAKQHIVGRCVYTEDIYNLDCFKEMGDQTLKLSNSGATITCVDQYETLSLDKNLTIEPTAGHTMECVSLIVGNCDHYGTVGLVGDLFEREEDIKNERIWIEAGTTVESLQRANRNRIYRKVDYILPGHGSLFKTDAKSISNF